MVFKQDWEKTSEHFQLDESILRTMVEMVFPTNKNFSIEVLSGGCGNLTAKIYFEKQIYILKISFKNSEIFLKEKALGPLLSAHEIKFAKYLDVGVLGTYVFGVFEYVEGITLRDFLLKEDPTCWYEMMRSVGYELSKLTHISFSKSGFFDQNLHINDPADYRTHLYELLENVHIINSIPHSLTKSIKSKLDKKSNPFSYLRASHLVHGDFDPSNILVGKNDMGEWALKAIIDWEFAFSGSILQDVANMLRYAHQVPHFYREGFLRGLRDGGVFLAPDWENTMQWMNICALLDCASHTTLEESPKRYRDIVELLEYFIEGSREKNLGEGF